MDNKSEKQNESESREKKVVSSATPAEESASEPSSRRSPLLAPGSLRFMIVFVVSVITVFIIYDRVKEGPQMAMYMSFLARQVGALLRLTGKSTVIIPAKAIIHYNGFSMQIIPDCGAIPSMSIFTAALLAFPARIRYKVWGLLLGLPLLYVVNVCRLVCLGFIGANFSRPTFHFAHIYVWQTIFIVFVVTLWFFWINYVTAEDKSIVSLLRVLWRGHRFAFALRFVCFGAIFLALFVVTLRAYAWFVVHVAGFCLEVVGGYDIRSATVGSLPPQAGVAGPTVIEDLLRLTMNIRYGDTDKAMPAAQLAYTLPPFLALMAATAGIKLRDRVTSAGLGLIVLVSWHIIMFCTFFVAAVSFGFTGDSPLVRAVGFVNPMLPFLLWFIMAGIRQVPNWGFSRNAKDAEGKT